MMDMDDPRKEAAMNTFMYLFTHMAGVLSRHKKHLHPQLARQVGKVALMEDGTLVATARIEKNQLLILDPSYLCVNKIEEWPIDPILEPLDEEKIYKTHEMAAAARKSVEQASKTILEEEQETPVEETPKSTKKRKH